MHWYSWAIFGKQRSQHGLVLAKSLKEQRQEGWYFWTAQAFLPDFTWFSCFELVNSPIPPPCLPCKIQCIETGSHQVVRYELRYKCMQMYIHGIPQLFFYNENRIATSQLPVNCNEFGQALLAETYDCQLCGLDIRCSWELNTTTDSTWWPYYYVDMCNQLKRDPLYRICMGTKPKISLSFNKASYGSEYNRILLSSVVPTRAILT